MTTPTPSSCTLNSSELPQRMTEIELLSGEAPLSVERGDRKAALHFRRNDQLRGRLEELVAKEAECCSFLDLEISEAADTITLSIARPHDAQPTINGFVSLLSGHAAAR